MDRLEREKSRIFWRPIETVIEKEDRNSVCKMERKFGFERGATFKGEIQIEILAVVRHIGLGYIGIAGGAFEKDTGYGLLRNPGFLGLKKDSGGAPLSQVTESVVLMTGVNLLPQAVLQRARSALGMHTEADWSPAAGLGIVGSRVKGKRRNLQNMETKRSDQKDWRNTHSQPLG